MAIGSKVEILSIKSKTSIRQLDLENGWCSTSTNNILAFATSKGLMRLWDVRNWEVVHSSTFDGLKAYSLHLTPDLKYLTIAGFGTGDKCVVMQIK